MDHEIFTWLNSDQDYPSGLLLYDQYCKNPNLGRILRIGGATGKNRLTLAYELAKVIRHLGSQPGMVPINMSDNPGSGEKDQATQIPAIRIEEIRKEQKMIFKMLDALHASLPYRDEAERCRIALEILGLDDRLREIYSRIDHYERTGILLPRPESLVKNRVSGKDSGELMRRKYTLRPYLTKYKKLLEESVSLKDRDRYQEKLDGYQQEMDEINIKLGP